MCSPVVGYVLSGVGLLAQVAGGQQQAAASQAQMNYQAQVAENNRQLAEQIAQDTEVRGEQEVERHRQRVRQLKGRQVAALAASGLDVESGSPLDVLSDTASLAAIDEETIRQNFARQAWQERVRGTNFGTQSDLLRTQAANTSSGAVGTLLTGIGRLSDRWFRS